MQPLVVAVTIGAVALVGSGYMLMPGSGWAAFGRFLTEPASWLQAAGLAKDLGLAQANAWFDAAASFQVASAAGACPRLALLWDLLFISCYAYVLARLCSRAFVRYVGWREVGGGGPSWVTWYFGASLGLLVAGDLVENLLGGLGFTFGRDSIFGPGSFCVGVLGALVKYAGLAGCCLLLLAYRARGRRRAQRPK